MTHVLDPFIHSFITISLDNICIYSTTPQDELFDHLRNVLIALREHKLFIKMVECLCAKRETEYLGFDAGNGIVRTSPSNKVVAVKV